MLAVPSAFKVTNSRQIKDKTSLWLSDYLTEERKNQGERRVKKVVLNTHLSNGELINRFK